MPESAESTVVSQVWRATTQRAELPLQAESSGSRGTRLLATAKGDLVARVLLIALYVLLTRNLLADFLQTGRFTGLLLLVSELLVLVFTLLRRRALTVDRSGMSLLTTAVSVAGPLLVRAAEVAVVPDVLTTFASAIGLAIGIGAKISLGRSFGIIPANRGIVVAGMYKFVRHPIYAGYLLTHVAFMFAHPTVRNIALLAIADSALVIRALREERLLAGDSEYQSYCRRVSWHLIPGLF
jgi:protein-S-isoprenylcysteine O-methyltransferase Ste14